MWKRNIRILSLEDSIEFIQVGQRGICLTATLCKAQQANCISSDSARTPIGLACLCASRRAAKKHNAKKKWTPVSAVHVG